MRRIRLLLLLCGVALGEDAPAFEEGMRAARRLLERGQWTEGRKQLTRLLEEHARAPYVLGNRVQVEELMRHLVFGATVKAPDPKELVSGELEQWNPRDGTITIRYTSKTMRDWTIQDGRRFVHPAAFRGPHTITIKGKYYSGGGGTVFACVGADRSLGIVAGDSRGRPAKIVLVEEGRKEGTILATAKSPATEAQPYTMRVTVNATEVVCAFGGKILVRGPKKADHWGSLAFDAAGLFEEVVITGKIEPSWIQGLVDERRQALLAEFERDWAPRDHLPAWLFEAGPVTASDAAPPRAWPTEMDGEATALAGRAIALGDAGDSLAALKLAEAWPEGQVPGPVRDYVRGLLLRSLGRHEEAVAACRKVREKEPDFLPVAEVEASALHALGRTDEAVALYRDLIGRFPRAPDLHADAALFLGAAGRWEDADALVRAALSSGVTSERLDRTSRLVHRAVRGPAWPQRHEYASQHYHVFSDMDPRICLEASLVLEQAYAGFSTKLERAPATRERFKVYLFSGEAGYQAHVADILGGTVPHSAGLYAPALRQLFIWNLPEREDMMKTVRHEGFHQYLHGIMDDPPLWFDEGLAEYFEGAKIVAGKWTLGEPRRDHLELVPRFQPLKTFLLLDDRAFMANAGPSYAQAWAFIRFLLHSTPENRQLFDRFWDAFKTIPSHADANRTALGDRSLDELDKHFQHVVGRQR